ncbi:MAG: response regulator [Chloroflexi bacterium]|nr:response regulator [Chloroflexota bacterium]
MHQSKQDSERTIRQRAEEIAANLPQQADDLSSESMHALLHELQVHQLELEMQNEELRRTQIELEISRARYFDLYDLAPLGYVTVSESGLILEANLTLANLLGVTRSGMVKRPFSHFIFPTDQDIYYFYRQKVSDDRPTQACELRLKHADDTTFWAELTGVIAPTESGESVFRITISNITQRKQAAKALRESYEHLEATLAELHMAQAQLVQQERLAAVGQLAAGIAHDFNNILAVISIYTEMSLTMPDLPPKLQERLAIINSQTGLAAHLVQQILDFGRRAVLHTRPLDLARLLQELVNLWQRTLPESITIHYNHQNLECAITGDAARLQQMFTNLALNARDAMPDGGELRIHLERLLVNPFDTTALPSIIDSNWALITIDDTGTGIADEALAHIFEPFFTTKEPGKGSGLGLAQAYGVVKQHQGHMYVQTEVGQGTTFTIYLPLLSTPLLQTTAVSPPAIPKGHGELILVVEDNDSLREGLAATLAMLNYQPLTAANGREALAILEQSAAALLLCDLIMPEMGGQELLQTMRQRGLTTPVVILSGHLLDTEQLAVKNFGVAAWLAKPPGIQELATAVAQAIPVQPADEQPSPPGD